MTHTDHLIPFCKVESILGIEISNAWLWCETKKDFSAPIRLSPHCTRRSLDEVNFFAEGMKLPVLVDRNVGN